MGNPSRCPSCNRFGSAELNGYCKDCYKEPEEKPQEPPKLFRPKIVVWLEEECKKNPKVAQGAYAELGKKIGDKLSENETRVIYNIIQRRKPVRRHGHIVRDLPPMEGYGYKFVDERDKYELIKEVCNYERVE